MHVDVASLVRHWVHVGLRIIRQLLGLHYLSLTINLHFRPFQRTEAEFSRELLNFVQVEGRAIVPSCGEKRS